MSQWSSTVEADEQLTGRTLGDFVVRERLGEGGYGAVYLADQPGLGRDAVIKVLHGRYQKRQDLIQRFLRESKLASRLDHPYAAHIYAFGAEQDGLLWIAMERVRGTPLDKLLERGPLPLDRLVPLVERIAEVVHSAHEQGIVHRDLKPANVMVLSRSGRLLPKLLDFGIAKLVSDAPEKESAAAPPGAREAAVESDTIDDDLEATGPTLVPAGDTETGRTAGATITQIGQVIGSPPYMAPEQWTASGDIGPHTDLYALGVMVYEALTGRMPFTGRTLLALAGAHARAPVPPAGSGMPRAIDAFFARALAKRGEDRFPTALELAAALRSAAELAPDAAELPRLASHVEDAFLADAPQPLAEAVASLAAARQPHQALEAAGMVVTIVVRYLASLGLAARAHVRVDTNDDSGAVHDGLRALRRRSLRDEEWLELARELCRPFARRQDTHPIPELVAFFFDRAGAPGPAATQLDRLVAQLAAMPAGARTDDLRLRATLARLMPELDRTLDGLGFVREYALAVKQEGVLESWTGVRRRHRIALPTTPRSAAIPDGHPLLLTRDGAPVLSLWPLCATAEPIPGTPRELFLFDGQGRHGPRHVALPDGYERRDDEIWSWLGEHVFDAGAEIATVAPGERAPYRGLAPFGVDDADLFFGREREIEALVNRLRTEAFIAVVGPSGAGKSSFVQAGVLPALPPGWRGIALRPGPDPLTSLAMRLAREGIDTGELRSRLRADPGALTEVLRARAADAVLVIVVDQFEELFTLCQSREEREAFVDALLGAARSAESSVRVIITLRDDFLLAAEQLPALRSRLAKSLLLVTTPTAAELERVLVEPARRLGYEFEDRALPAEMAAEVAALPSALPLLSFTAAKLWELRDRRFKQLGRRAYEQLGGVGGALAQHAEQTLAGLLSEEQRLVREAFAQLVTGDGTRAVLGRSELGRVLGGGPRADGTIEKLVAARLLVGSEGPNGEERIEIVHEALLDAWPRLVEWRRQDAEGSRLRDQLRAAAEQWHARGRPAGLLWRGESLDELQRWRARHAGRLPTTGEAFVAASLAEARRARRLRVGSVAFVFVTLVAALVGVTAAGRRAQRSAAQARARLAELHEEEGRALAVAGDPLRALAYLTAARAEGRAGVALDFLVGEALRSLAPQRLVLVAHTGVVREVAFSADGTIVASASEDHTVRLWNAATGAPRGTLRAHRAAVSNVEFSTDGRLLLTADDAGVACLWDVAGLALRATLRGHEGPIYPAAAHLDRSGRRAITGGADGTVRVWDTSTGAQLLRLDGHRDGGKGRFSQDGARIVSSEGGGVVRLWDARTGALLRELRGHEGAVFSARFSPDGGRVASAGYDGTIRLWNASSGALERSLQHHPRLAMDAVFSPDGRRLVSRASGAPARVWDPASGRLLFELDHRALIGTVTFGRKGTRLLTIGSDGIARVWDAATGHEELALVGHLGEVSSADFDRDGTQVVTGGLDGTVRLWTVAHDATRLTLAGHKGPVLRAGYSGDGRTLWSVGYDRTMRTWDASGGAPLRTLELPAGASCGTFDGGLERVAFVLGGEIHVRELDGTERLRPLGLGGATATSLAFSRDGTRLAAALGPAGAMIWRLDGKSAEQALRHDGWIVAWAQLSRSGDRLVTAHQDGTAVVWDVGRGVVLQALAGQRAPLNGAAFDVDDDRVVTASDDKTAWVWAAREARVLARLEGNDEELAWSSFAPDPGLVATHQWNGRTTLWDAVRARPLARWSSPTGAPLADAFTPGEKVAFSPDGLELVIAGYDGLVRVRPVGPAPLAAAELEARLRCLVPYRVGDRGLEARPIDHARCHGAR